MTKEEIICIRKRLYLTKPELAMLFGETSDKVGNWEQGRSVPCYSALTLYQLVCERDKDTLYSLARIACKKKHDSLKDIGVLKKLIKKIIKDKIARGFLEIMMHESNPDLLSKNPKFSELVTLLKSKDII